MLSLSRLKGHWLTALSRYIWDKDDEADEPLFQELPNAVSLFRYRRTRPFVLGLTISEPHTHLLPPLLPPRKQIIAVSLIIELHSTSMFSGAFIPRLL